MFKKSKDNGAAKKFLNRQEILEKKDIKTKDVYVEPWDGHVCVKGLTGKERDKWESSIVEMKKKTAVVKDNIRAKLVALSIVDPDTMKPIFAEADIEALGAKSAAALDVIFSEARKLSGISEDDVEELEKNSGKTHGEDSSSS